MLCCSMYTCYVIILANLFIGRMIQCMGCVFEYVCRAFKPWSLFSIYSVTSITSGLSNITIPSIGMSLGVCPVRMYNIVCGDMAPPTHTTQSFALSSYRKWALKEKQSLTSVTTRLSQACSCALQECLACYSSPVHRLTRAKYFKQYPIQVY